MSGDTVTPTQSIDAIRERHFPVAPQPVVGGEPDVCLTCDQSWPCDTRVVLGALEREGKLDIERSQRAHSTERSHNYSDTAIDEVHVTGTPGTRVVIVARTPPDYERAAICGACSGFGCGDCAGTGLAPREDTATCCELACYEDPGCLCDGCASARAKSMQTSALAADGKAMLHNPSDTGIDVQRTSDIGVQDVPTSGHLVAGNRTDQSGPKEPTTLAGKRYANAGGDRHHILAIEHEAAAQQQQLNDALRFALSDAKVQANAAANEWQALADTLAEALRNLGPLDKYGSGWAEARAALAAYEEATE